MIPEKLQRSSYRFCKLKKKLKAPFETDWQKNGYIYDDEKLLNWIKEGGNYGVIGGYGKLRIIDADDKIFANDIKEDIKTLTVETGSGGKHFYIISDYDTNHVFKDNVGELRANNYQVVGAGCTHPNGNKYKVVNDVPLLEIPKEKLKEILKPYLKPDVGSGSIEVSKIKDGSRSGIEFREVIKLIGSGKSKEEVFNAMQIYSKWYTSTPQYKELSYKKAKEYVNPDGNIDGLRKMSDKAKPEDFFTTDKYGKPKSFMPKWLGDCIKKKFHFKTIIGNDKQIYFYQKGYYKENGIALIRNISTSLLKDLVREHHVNETIAYIRNSTYIEADEIDNEWLNLKNGLLDVITKEFKAHNPDVFSLHQLPFEYDVAAKCNLFETHMRGACEEDWKYDVTQELFGYCLLKDQRFEVAFIFYGPKRTKKSTTLYILNQMLGPESVTAMSLQYIEEDRHGVAFLYGALANICADISSKELKNTGTFMKITGQDYITAGKKFEHEKTFLVFAKLIFSCNVVPPTMNKDPAFYRRTRLIGYENQTLENEIDVNMRNKLLEELPGILIWSLKGLDRLLKNNKFSYPLSEDDIKDLYERQSNTIHSFIYNEISTEFDDVAIKKRDVYAAYKKYCEENRLTPDNHTKFGREFIAITGCGAKRIGVIPAYAGVDYKNKTIKQKKLGGGEVVEEIKI